MSDADLPSESFMYRLPVIFVALALAACSSNDDFTPTAPGGPTVPTIGGTYSAPDMWRFELTLPDQQINITCGGGITIATQVGNDFSGTFFIRDNSCGDIGGTVTEGALENDGRVTFGLTVEGSNPNFLTAAFACTYVSGDQVLNGTLVGNQLQAEARTVMDCVPEGRGTLLLRLAGSR
jgi:hypothetical protein